jgi:hypothetical protein
MITTLPKSQKLKKREKATENKKKKKKKNICSEFGGLGLL